MRRIQITFALLILAVMLVVAPSAPATKATGTFEQQVVTLVNQERTSRGLPPLIVHYMLENAAQAHSMDMGTHNFCGHNSSDGTDAFTRIQSYGYTPFYGLAENVACGQSTPQQVVAAWMASSGHRANILGDYEHVGVGYYYNGNAYYRHYWTLDFGKPAPGTPPPASCNLQYDFDNSGVIDAGDIAIVAQHWGNNGGYDPAYDVHPDQTINVLDVMTVAAEWGTSCP